MVDSVVDNISLRTQRKAEIRLEIDIATPSNQLMLLVGSIKKNLKDKVAIETYQVHLAETGKQAHIITVDFFTSVEQSLNDFNDFKEEVNLSIIKLTEDLQIKFATNEAKK